MNLSQENLSETKYYIQLMLKFIQLYEKLAESYVIEFFTESHWEKIPQCWQDFLYDLEPPEMCQCLYSEKLSKVLPLSLMCFKKLCTALSLPRTKTETKHEDKMLPLFKHVFRKHVSEKKQHEIKELSKNISNLYEENQCNIVIDVGSGRGHLSRILAFAYGLNVATIEGQKQLSNLAEKYDKDSAEWIGRINNGEKSSNKFNLPKHFVHWMQSYPEKDDYIAMITNSSQIVDNKPRILLTGLHACGDLSANMFRDFVNCSDVKCILSVSCCYMKLSNHGYPLSNFVSSLPYHKLDYKSREIACHSLEDYQTQLLENGPHLRMHTYRATLESILRKKFPEVARSRVQVGRKSYLLTFEEYCGKSFKYLNLDKLSEKEILNNSDITYKLKSWHRVVTYYNLCQMLAPVIESIILLDRMIYLSENGHRSQIVPLFKPELSPRCFAIISQKQDDAL